MCLTTTKRRKMIEVTEEDNVPDQHQKTKDDRGYRRG